MTSCIAIIPARGGSKRIPRKNIKPFLDKPIIAYSIEAALNSGLFSEVMVSTDDEEIAEIAKSYGASIPFFRSRENADDFATTYDVINEVLKLYEAEGKKFESGCCIYPTAPFVNPELLLKAKSKMEESNFDVVFPILEYSFPIWRSLQFDRDKVSFWWPENATKRSQDLPKAFHDAGQFYWFKVSAIKREKKLITQNSGGVIIHPLEAHDIDNPEDWEVAEWKYQFKVASRLNRF